MLETHAGWSALEALELVQGYSQVSARAGDDLATLADAIQRDPEALALLDAGGNGLVGYNGPAGAALRMFLEHHGHKPITLHVERPMWAEAPAQLFPLLRAHMARPATVADAKARAAAAEMRARTEVPASTWPQIKTAIDRARRVCPLQDDTEGWIFAGLGPIRYAAVEAGRRLADRGVFARADDVWFLTIDELLEVLGGQPSNVDVSRRRGEYRWGQHNALGRLLGPVPGPMPAMPFPKACRDYLNDFFWGLKEGVEAPSRGPQPGDQEADMVGTPASSGLAQGTVRVIPDASQLHRLRPGDILVCAGTNASWSFAFNLAGGVLTELGGPLSHPAILAREFGLPAVLGVDDVTTQLNDGDQVRMDGATGQIWVLARARAKTRWSPWPSRHITNPAPLWPSDRRLQRHNPQSLEILCR